MADDLYQTTVAQAHALIVRRVGIQMTDQEITESFLIPYMKLYANLAVTLTPLELIEDNIGEEIYASAISLAGGPGDQVVLLPRSVLRVLAVRTGPTGLIRYVPQSRPSEWDMIKVLNATKSTAKDYVYSREGLTLRLEPTPPSGSSIFVKVLNKPLPLDAGGTTVVQVPSASIESFLCWVTSIVANKIGELDKGMMWYKAGCDIINFLNGKTVIMPDEQGKTPSQRARQG